MDGWALILKLYSNCFVLFIASLQTRRHAIVIKVEKYIFVIEFSFTFMSYHKIQRAEENEDELEQPQKLNLSVDKQDCFLWRYDI